MSLLAYAKSANTNDLAMAVTMQTSQGAISVYLGGAVAPSSAGGSPTGTVDMCPSVVYVPIPAPSTPTGLIAGSVTSNSVALKWSPSTDVGGPGVGGYNVYRSDVTTGPIGVAFGQATTTYTDTTVAANTAYSYSVAAFDTTTPTEIVSLHSLPLSVTTAAVGALTCSGPSGSGTNGLGFDGPTSYQISTISAGATPTDTLSWGVSYNGPAAYTGSLRVRLWALTSNYSGGSISGAVLSQISPNFTGAYAQSPNQLKTGGSAINITSTGTGSVNPAAGSYCIVATLEQYVNATTGFLIEDWVTFPNTLSFN
jgi:hypothetical protein